jgi:hypothetical protein
VAAGSQLPAAPSVASPPAKSLSATLLLAASVPPLLLGWILWCFAVDVPVLDQWNLPYDYDRYQRGEWTFADLARSQNAHRILIPRLILVPLAQWTGWNTRVEVLVSVVLGLGLLALWLHAARPLLGGLPRSLAIGVTFLISLALFSLNQFENWIWGIMMHAFLAMFAVALGLHFLARDRLRPWHWLGAVVAGGVATFSHAAGPVFWWAAALPVALGAGERRGRWQRTLALLALAAVVSWLYFQNWAGDPVQFEPTSRGFHLGAVLYFAATLLGAPVAEFAGSAWPARDSGIGALVGVLGLVAWGVLGWRELRRQRGRAEPWLKWTLAHGAFAVGAALLSGLGRGSGGGPVAFASRYATLSTPFWLGLIFLVVRSGWPTRTAASPPVRRWVRTAAAAALLLLFVGVSTSYIVCLGEPINKHRILSRARIALFHGRPDFLLSYLHRGLPRVHAGRPILEQYRLSVFRDGERFAPRLAEPTPLSTFEQSLRLVDGEGILSMRAGVSEAIQIVVSNPSPVPWPSVGTDIAGTHSVRLGWRWLDAGGRAIVEEGSRADLPFDLAPGDAVTIWACLPPPRHPGRYRLRFSMVQDAVAWFDGAGSPALEVDVAVGTLPGQGLLSPILAAARDLGWRRCG